MREPTRDEMQIAIILLEEMTLPDDARALLKRISVGEVVQKEGLVLLRSLGDTFVKQKTARSGKPKLANLPPDTSPENLPSD
jgi:hypothetical protein